MPTSTTASAPTAWRIGGLNDIPVGKTERIELEGGMFSIEQVYLSKPRSEGFFESHRAFIDVQVIFSGEEFLEVTDIALLTVKEDRTPERDVIIYDLTETASVLRLRAGEAAVFFSGRRSHALPRDQRTCGHSQDGREGPRLVNVFCARSDGSRTEEILTRSVKQ